MPPEAKSLIYQSFQNQVMQVKKHTESVVEGSRAPVRKNKTGSDIALDGTQAQHAHSQLNVQSQVDLEPSQKNKENMSGKVPLRKMESPNLVGKANQQSAQSIKNQRLNCITEGEQPTLQSSVNLRSNPVSAKNSTKTNQEMQNQNIIAPGPLDSLTNYSESEFPKQ